MGNDEAHRQRDLQDVLEAVLDGVVVVDRDSRVEFVNSEACRMLETSAEFAAGLPLARVAGPEFEALARSVLEVGRPAVQDDRALARRFSPDVIVDVAASPLWGEQRETPSGVVLALRDRTIHRSLAERAAERDRLSAYGTIAAGIAHEVKNPLGGIRGAAEILASRASDAKAKDTAALIVREVDRIRALVDDLLVFHQRPALELSPQNIHRLLDQVLELLSMDPLATGVKLERSFDPSIPDLRADPSRLTQVFLNLGRNALQALDAASRARAEGERSPANEGTLLVETRMALDQRLPSARGASVPTVAITVADDGPGIAPEVFEQLSTPFFTTRAGGTGLGLAVSRHWVARHGGALRLESEPGRGTRVRVFLPIGGPEVEDSE